MQMILITLFSLVLPVFAAGETLLEQAKRVVPEDADYRLIEGEEEECPGEGTIFWRELKTGPYLMLTPSMGIPGFDKSGWVEIPENARDKNCKFERFLNVTRTMIDYAERESCTNSKYKRDLKRTLSLLPDGKLSLKLVVTSEGTAPGKRITTLSCLLVRLPKPGSK